MQYLISFLEGIITFISPCLLPMLPIYISYFAGGNPEGRRRQSVKNAVGFILGFTLVFVILGAFAGTVGRFLQSHKTAVNIVTGGIVILFGLNFLGILNIKFLNRTHTHTANTANLGFFSSALFGIIFSVGWTPCVGAFLGSALMLASQQGSALQGVLLLLCYSLGLGIPFFMSAFLIDQLKNGFAVIKRHYTLINRICGAFLLLVGVMMATGTLGYLLSVLSF